MPQTGSSEQRVWASRWSPPCYANKTFKSCQRGWEWTESCWFLDSVVPLGQSSPAAAERPPYRGIRGCVWSLLWPSTQGLSSGALREIPVVRVRRSPCLGRKCSTDSFGPRNHPGWRVTRPEAWLDGGEGQHSKLPETGYKRRNKLDLDT